MRHWFHPEATAELIESACYYENQRSGLGLRFLDAAAEVIRRIEAHPQMYRIISDSWRQCRVLRFPFGIIYRVADGRVEIIVVMHLSRKPGYWRQRTADQ